jgi:hypothetical protein
MPAVQSAPMQASPQQPATPRPQPRPKPVVVGVVRRPDVAPVRRRAFVLPDVREIPRRAAAGPWEAGW